MLALAAALLAAIALVNEAAQPVPVPIEEEDDDEAEPR